VSASPTLPDPAHKGAFVRAMFDRIAPRYDLMNRLLTGGMDQRWRRMLLRWLAISNGDSVLDLATGTGDLAALAARGGARVVGADLALGMLKQAQVREPRQSLAQADGTRLPFRDASVDAVTCGFALRNFTDLPATFAECARVLRPGGRLGVLEVDRPRSRALCALHTVYFDRVVPRIGGWLSDREAYRYLPESTAFLPPFPVLREQLERAGFTTIEKRTCGLGAVQALRAVRRAP
jgi:demethylmenaquinone methyltransferase/2-methoxy-6-polyprenyl-1,4-benzoquinol methylase